MTPCTQCGEPGVRDLGSGGYCAAHLEELYLTFDPAVFAFNGVGLQSGPLCPEYGPHFAHLTCIACAATWVGVPGENCGWCARALKGVIEEQAELDRKRA